MITVQEYISDNLKDIDGPTLIKKMGISLSMLSAYKKFYNPSLDVAINVYKTDKVTLHPFSEESLKYEINKGR